MVSCISPHSLPSSCLAELFVAIQLHAQVPCSSGSSWIPQA